MPSIDDFMPEAPVIKTNSQGFAPTPEQEAIVKAVVETEDNLLISALAGAAKTSTLVLIAEALPKTPILSLAFNTRIAKEMTRRMPSTAVCKTLNSMGHTAWAKFLNKRFLEVNDKKTFLIVKDIIEETENKKEKAELYKLMADIMRAVDYGKSAGYIPTGHYPHAKPLMDDAEFFASLEEEVPDFVKDVIRAATLRSLEYAFQGNIDFADQLLMPTVFRASFPQYPLVLVDEAQDLSALNHAMLDLMVKKRVIAVGDECQSIYGFRGAHENSMRLLQQTFSMKELILSVSFRCPIKVVEEARWRAPHMRYPDWAKEGKVEAIGLWDAKSIPDNAVILCRNNAPLFAIAIKLLKNGRYPEIVGNDIGKALLKILRGLGDLSMNQEETLAAIQHWRREKLEKSRNKQKVEDQVRCLEIFAKQGKDLGMTIAYCERILNVAGPIKLMTGHKSKGLEFDDVYILDQDLIGDDPQDKNLRYVMQTRAKSSLNYIRSVNFDDEADDE